MYNKLFDTPILLIAFNRPETTCYLFEQIRKIKPRQLYIFSDSPRPHRPKEEKLVETCRCLLDDSQIDWECQVERWYPEFNMGCAIGISSAISWAFETCERLIVLEDDCLPHPTFFVYCEAMLSRYDGNDKVMHISGALWGKNGVVSEADHCFSPDSNIRGWATWKRAWRKYDFWMEEWPELKADQKFQTLCANDKSKAWEHRFEKTYGEVSKKNWEVQWQYTIFKSNGVTVVPNVNLISHIDVTFLNQNSSLEEGAFVKTEPWKQLYSQVDLAGGLTNEQNYMQTPFVKEASESTGIVRKLINIIK